MAGQVGGETLPLIAGSKKKKRPYGRKNQPRRKKKAQSKQCKPLDSHPNLRCCPVTKESGLGVEKFAEWSSEPGNDREKV
jgi:hypothetical protein